MKFFKLVAKALTTRLYFRAVGAEGGSQAKPVAAAPLFVTREAQHYTPVYPPTDPGIPFVEVESIVASQEELIDRIMKAAALDDDSSKYIPELIRNFAAYVHLLPASRMEQYPGNGGLFRMGLEVGFYALRASHGVIFASEIAEVRVKSNPRWRIATFVAGMLADTFRAVVLMRAITNDGAQWNPFTHPLATHLKQRGADRYYIKWMKDAQENQAFNNLIVGSVVPPPLLSYLAELGPHIVGAMLEAISGAGDTPLSKTVQRTRSGLINRDKQANPNFVGRPMMGSHLEAHVIDVMRSLVRSGKWHANRNGQPLWNARDGLYLVIQTGWKDLYGGLMSAGFSGIPTDFEVVAEILLKAGVIARSKTGGAVFNIKLPTFEKCTFEAVKLTSGVTAFGDAYQGFESIEGDLIHEHSPPRATRTNPPAAGGDVADADAKEAAAEDGARTKEMATAPVAKKQTPPRKETTATTMDTQEAPPDIGDILAAMDEGEPLQQPRTAPQEDAYAGVNQAKWGRYKSKLGLDVSAWLEDVMESTLRGDRVAHETTDGYGFPAKSMDQKGLSRGVALTALFREGILWTPPGETKKIIEIDGEQYVFINKRFWDEVTK